MNQSDHNLLPIAEEYFKTIFSEITGMKAILLDLETIGIISVIYSQSKLFKNDIYLIQKIFDKGEKMPHLKAICFLRPTKENLDFILKQLKEPRYMEYHLYFTNEISQDLIKTLAENDTNNKIKSLQEVYLDFFAIGRNIFTLNIPSTIKIQKRKENWTEDEFKLLDRIYCGLVSVVMSLRVIPQIRYLANSDSCFELASRLAQKFQREYMQKKSDYKIDQRAILILSERKQDVVTPLLIPWTYQAMIHEFIGFANNKVDLENKHKTVVGFIDPNHKPNDKKEFVLSQLNDDFYTKNLFNTFGELAANIKKFIDQVGEKRNKATKIQSLEDMHHALDNIPQLTQISANVSKHVTLSVQISEQIEKGKLMEVSKIEQDLVCQESRSENIDSIWKILKNPQNQNFDKLKLVLLFSIKYPNDKQLKEFLAFLATLISDQKMLNLTKLIQLYQSDRISDLFHNSNIKKKAKSFFDRLLKDVPNVYTQHKSYLFEAILPQILSGKMKQSDYPIAYKGSGTNYNQKPLVITFQIGGTTFTEACEASQFQQARVVVGGTFIHNSRSLLAELISMHQEEL